MCTRGRISFKVARFILRLIVIGLGDIASDSSLSMSCLREGKKTRTHGTRLPTYTVVEVERITAEAVNNDHGSARSSKSGGHGGSVELELTYRTRQVAAEVAAMVVVVEIELTYRTRPLAHYTSIPSTARYTS